MMMELSMKKTNLVHHKRMKELKKENKIISNFSHLDRFTKD